MTVPRIIGLNGKKGAGKDTAGAHLVEAHGFEALSFAAPLKESAAALFGLDPKMWEEMKNDPTSTITLYLGTDRLNENGWAGVELTAREFLQRYGTEAHRDVFGASFWTDMAILKIRSEPDKKFVITDARFINECSALRAEGGIIVEVERPGTDDTDTHASEEPLPRELIDATFVNSGSIEDLQQMIDLFVVHYGTEADADYRYVLTPEGQLV